MESSNAIIIEMALIKQNGSYYKTKTYKHGKGRLMEIRGKKGWEEIITRMYNVHIWNWQKPIYRDSKILWKEKHTIWIVSIFNRVHTKVVITNRNSENRNWNGLLESGMVACGCNLSTLEAEVDRLNALRPTWSSKRVPDQSGLHREANFK